MVVVRHQAFRSTADLWISSSLRRSAAAHCATLDMQTLDVSCQGGYQSWSVSELWEYD